MKVNLPEEMGRNIRKYLNNNGLSIDDGSFVFDKNMVFLSEELDSITELNLKHADIRYLNYFHNLSTLVIDHFPSITNMDLESVINNCPNLTTLVIKNQADLTEVNVSKLGKLKCLSLISNPNLVKLSGIEAIRSLDNFEFYDNKAFVDVNYLIKFVTDFDREFSKVKLDLLYYPATIKYLKTLYDDVFQDLYSYLEENVIWSEMYGFREPKSRYFTTGEVQSTYEKVLGIIDEVGDKTLSDKENFVRLYTWLVNNLNIPFITLNKNYNSIDGTCTGLQTMQTTASFAPRILQFMLKCIDIDSEVIEVYTPLDEVKKIGAVSSDYVVLRTNFDDYSFSNLSLDIIKREFEEVPTYDNLFVDYDTIYKTNKIIHCSIFDPSVGLTEDERKLLVVRATKNDDTDKKKRKDYEMDSLSSTINVEVARDNIRKYYNLMSSNSITLSDYLGLKKKLAEERRVLNKYSILGNNAKTMIDGYGKMDVYDSKAFIEKELGIMIDIYDRSNVSDDGLGNYPLKTASQLLSEKDRLVKYINREEQAGVIVKNLANRLRSKIEYVYGYFLRRLPRENSSVEEYINEFVDSIVSFMNSEEAHKIVL